VFDGQGSKLAEQELDQGLIKEIDTKLVPPLTRMVQDGALFGSSLEDALTKDREYIVAKVGMFELGDPAPYITYYNEQMSRATPKPDSRS